MCALEVVAGTQQAVADNTSLVCCSSSSCLQVNYATPKSGGRGGRGGGGGGKRRVGPIRGGWGQKEEGIDNIRRLRPVRGRWGEGEGGKRRVGSIIGEQIGQWEDGKEVVTHFSPTSLPSSYLLPTTPFD